MADLLASTSVVTSTDGRKLDLNLSEQANTLVPSPTTLFKASSVVTSTDGRKLNLNLAEQAPAVVAAPIPLFKVSSVVTSTDGRKLNLNLAEQAPAVVTAPITTTPTIITPPPIPLSFNDALFSGNASSAPVTIASGTTLLKKSIAVHAEPASVVMGANTTMKNCAVGGLSREGVRIGGSTYVIDGCYLEAKGSGDDHADTIQAYAGPSGGKTYLTVRNTLIKAYNTAATAGLFLSDNCTGSVTCENVVFQGGPYGLRLHADVGGNIDVSLKDVFFVGPFGYAPFMFLDYGGGKVVITKWENVRQATIVNSKLVPGNAIPKP